MDKHELKRSGLKVLNRWWHNNGRGKKDVWWRKKSRWMDRQSGALKLIGEVINPLKTGNTWSNAPRLPKELCFLERSQVLAFSLLVRATCRCRWV